MNYSVSVQKFFSQIFLHLFLASIIIWASGCCISVVTGEYSAVGINAVPYSIFYKWAKWLVESYNDISILADIENFGYLKIKIITAGLVPFVLASIPYYIYWDNIVELNIFAEGEKIHGDAKWGSSYDIKRAGLRAKKGMILGVDNTGYYVAGDFQHALLFAPTGSGKGVGFVIPNLLFWEDSIIVHDIKLENYDLTSGWRASQGQKCYVWEPANPDGISHCYNPLDWVSSKPGQMVDDVQKICNLVLPKQDFWENEARSLLLAVILYLIADPNKVATFGEVVRTMRSDDVAYTFAVVLDTMGGEIHPVAYMNLAAFLQKADKERSGVISTLNSSLELWANPLIDSTTARSDFNFMNIKREKTTIYVGLTPDNIARLTRLMQVFYQQATEFLSRKIPDKKEEPYGVMFLMDEFPTLGKMEQFKTGIAYFRGYRVRLFLIVQDTQQLKGIYEDSGMNSFLSNSTFRITFSANNYETANLISQLCGNKTVESKSYSRKVIEFAPLNQSVSISKTSRALLLPQEVMLLPRDEQILLIESYPPIKSKKIIYFKDSFFTARLLPPVFVPTQKPYDPNANSEQETGNQPNDDEAADDLENEEQQ